VTEVFMIAGAAGSGKTTLGRALAERASGVSLDLDDVTADLVRDFLRTRPDCTEAEALGLLRDERYAELAACARDLLTAERPPILVLIAPFTAEISSAERWEGWLAGLDMPTERVHLVWLSVPDGERLRRLSDRGATRDLSVVANGEAGLPEAARPVVPALSVDARLSGAEQVEIVVQRFGNASL
jgi:hypothetical protein